MVLNLLQLLGNMFSAAQVSPGPFFKECAGYMHAVFICVVVVSVNFIAKELIWHS